MIAGEKRQSKKQFGFPIKHGNSARFNRLPNASPHLFIFH